jgi:hypothetical protein
MNVPVAKPAMCLAAIGQTGELLSSTLRTFSASCSMLNDLGRKFLPGFRTLLCAMWRHRLSVSEDAPWNSGTDQIVPFVSHLAHHRFAECWHDGAIRHVIKRWLADVELAIATAHRAVEVQPFRLAAQVAERYRRECLNRLRRHRRVSRNRSASDAFLK